MHYETLLFPAAPGGNLSAMFNCSCDVIFTLRAALGVESSLYGPSAHFLFDILRL